MNLVILSGIIARKDEIKPFENNGKVINGCIAVSRDYQNKDGKYDADFINLAIFNNQADYFNQKVLVGDRIELVGKWQTRSYENETGKHIKNECAVSSFKIIGHKPVSADDKIDVVLDTPKDSDDPLPF